MGETTLIVRFGIALAIGLVVGLERGWRERDAPAGSRTAGIRTYGLSALLGAVVAAVANGLASPVLVAAGLAAFGAVFAWFASRAHRLPPRRHRFVFQSCRYAESVAHGRARHVLQD